MANIEEMALHYRELGYSERNADARVCQDMYCFDVCMDDEGKSFVPYFVLDRFLQDIRISLIFVILRIMWKWRG